MWCPCGLELRKIIRFLNQCCTFNIKIIGQSGMIISSYGSEILVSELKNVLFDILGRVSTE